MANADKKQYILGYDAKQNRLYMVDKNFNIYSYSLLLSVVSYQAAILNGELEEAEQVFKHIPDSHYNKLIGLFNNEKRKISAEAQKYLQIAQLNESQHE